MIPAFWDSSALVPLCVEQRPSAATGRLLKQYSVTVWWNAPVEIRSALERLLRMKELTPDQHAAAGLRLDHLRRTWRELQPSVPLRDEAERLLTQHPLKAADALQLAAACTWASSKPDKQVFLCADVQLSEAARQLGFQVVVA